MRPASGNDLKTVLLHRTAFLCVSRFLRLASFGTVNALMIAISVTFQPLFSVIPKIFNKLKALTGYAPADYIRMIRLQHAAKLLKQGEYTITEIADMIGFSDAKYFREVFKKYYNVSPSQFNKKPEE